MRSTFYLTILFLISTIQLFGQLYVNDSLINYDNKICSSITIEHNNSEISKGDFHINSAEITDECLRMDFSYGGGCGKFYLRMLADTSVDFISQAYIKLFPQFIDNDLCKAIKYNTVFFDLDFLLKKRNQPFVLEIEGYNKAITVK